MLRLRNTHRSYRDTTDVSQLQYPIVEIEQSKRTFSSHSCKQLLLLVVAGLLKTETAPRSAWKTNERSEAVGKACCFGLRRRNSCMLKKQEKVCF
jgi:hypothetical protein